MQEKKGLRGLGLFFGWSAVNSDRGSRHDRRSVWNSRLVLLALAAATVAIAPIRVPANSRTAHIPSDLKPLVDVHEFMEHVVDNTFAKVKQGLADEPVDFKAWRAVRDASLLLGESGNLLLIRKPDAADSAEWSKLSIAMRESGDALTKAAKSKDYDASRKTYLAVVQSCNQCHIKFTDGEPKIEP
jgi:hypothetical protein